MTVRCNKFLSNIGAPPYNNIVEILNDSSTTSKQAIETLHNYLYPNLPHMMKTVSEWCALLDYCEVYPLRLSKARLAQDGPIQPLWIVGAGSLVHLSHLQFYLFLAKVGDRNCYLWARNGW